MEEAKNKMKTLQETLNSLFLQPNKVTEEIFTEIVLFGRIMNTQVFRRFTVTENHVQNLEVKA